MTFPISSPITGAAVTGLTSPTYTLGNDQGPNMHSSQSIITALGGTQTGVLPHSASTPFTFTWERPNVYRNADAGILAAAGLISRLPKNDYILRLRKSGDVNSLGGRGIFPIECYFRVPVNMTEEDAVEVAAAISCFAGGLYASADDIYAAIMNNTI